MKTFLKSLLLTLCLVALSFSMADAQKEINIINDGAAIGAGVDEATKNQIEEVVQELMNKYYNIASFWDEVTDSFDEDKYTQFISLFSTSARVYDDIANEPTNIDYSNYSNNVFEYMQEEGVQFDLENAYLNSIDKDDSGFYIAELDIDKIVYVGLDKNNFPVKFGDGKRYTLNVRIDMPDYDITSAKIEAIKGEETAKRVATASYLTGNFHYGLGGYTLGAPNEIGQSFGEITSSTASVLGFQLIYRKALSSKENFWFHIGAGAQQHSLSTSYPNFNNSALAGDKRSRSPYLDALINGEPPQPYLIEPEIPGADKTLFGNVTINSITDALEKVNIITVDVPIGITMRLNRTFSSRVFLDLSVVPSYSISSNGASSGTAVGEIIPDSQHFPGIAEIEALDDGEERLSDYRFTGEYNDGNIALENNFGLGIQLSPTYQYDISFNYGIEIGVNLWYNVMSLTKYGNSTNGYLSNDFANGSFTTKTSILEDYFNGVNPYYASIKVGFFYKLN